MKFNGHYTYSVNGKTYTHYESRGEVVQVGDQFKVIFDENNPRENLILFYYPVMPIDSLASGTASIVSMKKKKTEYLLKMEYYWGPLKCFRWAYTTIEQGEELNSYYKTNTQIPIFIYTPNPFRAYIDTSLINK